MKKLILSLVVFGLMVSASAATRAERLRAAFDSRCTNYVFVVAHRADWRHHPENSIPAIEGAIAMGVDMVELDVAKTKDGVHVLSHDGRLDRVSDRSGKIADLTLNEVKAARLREGQGGKNAALTDVRVPTLEEALEACRGRVLVNIDKFNSDPEGITAVIERLGVAKQVVLKGIGSYEAMKKQTGEPWKFVEARQFIYMPILHVGKDAGALEKARKAFAAWDRSAYAPPAYEVCIPGEAPRETLFADLRASARKPRLWINTLWDSLAHEHSESLGADAFTAERVWGWCLDLGATLIQTDRPKACIEYLESVGRHTL